jgi:hypothetical protein
MEGYLDMAGTTPINAWPYPTDTDYVYLGAQAIESLADSIDTSVGSGLLAWTSWAPVLSSGWLNGNGVWTARYAQIGKIVIVSGYFVVGSTTTKGTTMTVTLPVTSSAITNMNGIVQFQTTAGGTMSVGQVFPASTSAINLNALGSAGTHVNVVSVSPTVPITWATNSVVSFTAIYQAA